MGGPCKAPQLRGFPPLGGESFKFYANAGISNFTKRRVLFASNMGKNIGSLRTAFSSLSASFGSNAAKKAAAAGQRAGS
jgi:hypothetical protein